MYSKDWENHTLEEVRTIKSKIRKYRDKSLVWVVIGTLLAFFGLDNIKDIIKNIKTQDVDGRLVAVSVLLLILGLGAYLWAVTLRNKAFAIETELFKWEPSDDEISDIRKRFDNDFVRGILSEISPTETESVTVGLGSILINNNEGDVSINLNREGYRNLTNYESRQLAYYIGCEAFPAGFILHQLKKYATVYDDHPRGYLEVGEVYEKKGIDEEELARKNVIWLLKNVSKLTGIKKLKPEEEEAKRDVIEGGHIVLNKGYSENTEKYKDL